MSQTNSSKISLNNETKSISEWEKEIKRLRQELAKAKTAQKDHQIVIHSYHLVLSEALQVLNQLDTDSTITYSPLWLQQANAFLNATPSNMHQARYAIGDSVLVYSDTISGITKPYTIESLSYNVQDKYGYADGYSYRLEGSTTYYPETSLLPYSDDPGKETQGTFLIDKSKKFVGPFSDAELNWLANHLDGEYFTSMISVPEQYEHLVQLVKGEDQCLYYRLAPQYNSIKNQQIIIKRHQELGLE